MSDWRVGHMTMETNNPLENKFSVVYLLETEGAVVAIKKYGLWYEATALANGPQVNMDDPEERESNFQVFVQGVAKSAYDGLTIIESDGLINPDSPLGQFIERFTKDEPNP